MRIIIEGSLTPTRAEIERPFVMDRGEAGRLLVDTHSANRISGHTNASTKSGLRPIIGLRFPFERHSSWARGHHIVVLPRIESTLDSLEPVSAAT